MTTQELLQKAKAAKRDMAAADTKTKNAALLAMAELCSCKFVIKGAGQTR